MIVMFSKKKYECRLCLEKSEFSYSLLNANIPNMIESLTSIKITAMDILPTTCCKACLANVQIAYHLQQKILESDKKLRQQLVNNSTAKYIENDLIDAESSNDVKSECQEFDLHTFYEIKNESNDSDNMSYYDEICGDSSEKSFQVLHGEKKIIEICGDTSEKSIQDSHGEKQTKTVESVSDEITVISIDKTSNMDKKLDRIVRKHNKKKKDQDYKCTECNIKFEDRYSLSLHLKKHDVTTCTICQASIRTDNFKKHFERHTAGKEVCEICGSVAKNKESLRGHMFHQHRTDIGKYECKECNREFRCRYKYTMHIKKVHTGERNYQCEICGKKFFTAFDTKKHVDMTHYKARPYVCKYCNRGYSSKYALKTHVRQHTLETPYRCELCAAGFRQRVSLRTHLKSKHKITDRNVLYGKVISLANASKCDTNKNFDKNQISVNVEIIENVENNENTNLISDHLNQDNINLKSNSKPI